MLGCEGYRTRMSHTAQARHFLARTSGPGLATLHWLRAAYNSVQRWRYGVGK